MKAIELCKTAHEVGWSVIISTSKDAPETMDTFLSDFAVGIGSSQLHVGGLHAAEYSCKLNRILDISHEIPENSNIQFLGSNFRK
jgi:enolase